MYVSGLVKAVYVFGSTLAQRSFGVLVTDGPISTTFSKEARAHGLTMRVGVCHHPGVRTSIDEAPA